MILRLARRTAYTRAIAGRIGARSAGVRGCGVAVARVTWHRQASRARTNPGRLAHAMARNPHPAVIIRVKEIIRNPVDAPQPRQ